MSLGGVNTNALNAAPASRRRRRPEQVAIAHAKVRLWDEVVGTVTEYANGRIGFAYAQEYIESGIAISPLRLPLESRTFDFPELGRLEAFLGLPGVLADSLPDTFGNLIIKAYFEAQGEREKALSPVQRLLYVGNRAMGALEYAPHLQRRSPEEARALEVKALVESARRLIEGGTGDAVQEIMRVGGSAGGARAKALILWDRQKKRVRSGFAPPREGEEHWLIKFDGVGSANALDGKAKPFNRIEYTYALLAKQLGIDMEEIDYLEDGELFHFMTRRFDRRGKVKRHLHSLGGMVHVDYNQPQAYSYDALFRLINELQLGQPAVEETYRRLLFNIVGRNQDDHVKNISFLMADKGSGWALSPAYDLTYSAGAGYTRAHQMTLSGAADNFTRQQLLDFGRKFDVRHPERLLDATLDAFAGWPGLGRQWGVTAGDIERVAAGHRLYLRESA